MSIWAANELHKRASCPDEDKQNHHDGHESDRDGEQRSLPGIGDGVVLEDVELLQPLDQRAGLAQIEHPIDGRLLNLLFLLVPALLLVLVGELAAHDDGLLLQRVVGRLRVGLGQSEAVAGAGQLGVGRRAGLQVFGLAAHHQPVASPAGQVLAVDDQLVLLPVRLQVGYRKQEAAGELN